MANSKRTPSKNSMLIYLTRKSEEMDSIKLDLLLLKVNAPKTTKFTSLSSTLESINFIIKARLMLSKIK